MNIILAILFSLLFLLPFTSLVKADKVEDKNTLIIGTQYTPKSIDPHINTSLAGHNINRALFEGLCTDGPEEDGKAYPGVAESWTHSPDYKIWTFKLRKSNTWSDGKPLTSNDFIYSFERILNPTNDAKYSSMLFEIDNAQDYNKGKITDFSKVGIKALDLYTLEIKTSNPIPYLPELAKHYTWYPVPQHILKNYSPFKSKWTAPENIVTNGPFILKQNTESTIIKVIKNDKYWDVESVKISAIHFLPSYDFATHISSFQNKRIHLINNIPQLFIKSCKTLFTENYYKSPSFGATFLRCNVQGNLKNKLVRKAISLVLNRALINKIINKNSKQTSSSFTPSFGNYTPPKITTTNIAEAKRLMTEAGFPKGNNFPEIKLITTDKTINSEQASMISEQLQSNLGISVIIEPLRWPNYLNKIKKLDYDLATGGWIGDYKDPSTFLNIWRENDPNNHTGWVNKKYDHLILSANLAETSKKRMKLLADAEKMMLEEYPIINLFHYSSHVLLQPDVKGWKPRINNDPPYKHLSLKR